MMNWGRVALGTVIPFMFTTYDGATGASEEGSGLAVTDIEIYKAGGGLTQRSSDSGYALLDADGHALDSIVGLAGFSVDTGDNTDAGFFVAGGYYIVVVSSVTVDTQTVNFIAGTFSLGPTLTVAGVEEVDITHIAGSAVSTTTAQLGVNTVQAGGTAWGSGAITAASIATDAIGAAELADGAITAATFAAGAIDATAIATGAIDADALAADAAAEIADAVWDEDATGHQTGGTFGQAIGDPGASTETLFKAIVTDPAGTNIAADVIAIKAETAAILDDTDDIGVAGAGLTAVDDAILAILGTPAGASMSADIAAIEAQTDDIGVAGAGLTAVPWNAAWDAEVESEATDALNAYDPPTRAEATSDKNEIAAYLNGLVMVKGTIGATGNDTTHLHLDGLTFGNDEINGYYLAIRDVSESETHIRAITDWVLATELATVATLPFTPEDSVDTYWLLFAQAAAAGAAPTAAEVADAVWDEAQADHVAAGSFGETATEVAAILVDTGTTLDGKIDTIDTNVDSILVDTNELQTDWTNGGRLDLLIDAALADTNELQTDWVNGGRLDLLIDAIKAKTDNLPAAPAATGDIPSANANADALLDRAAGVETGLTPRQALRLFAAALLGKASGLATTTAVYRDTGDSKDRITATVDADGNRSAVTLDAS